MCEEGKKKGEEDEESKLTRSGADHQEQSE